MIPNAEILVPWESRQGVYFLCDGEEVVYVGASKMPFGRLSQHKKDKAFKRALFIPVTGTRKELLQYERKMISHHKPRYNKNGLLTEEQAAQKLREYQAEYVRNRRNSGRVIRYGNMIEDGFGNSFSSVAEMAKFHNITTEALRESMKEIAEERKQLNLFSELANR